jgi:hypothetical protein
MPKGSLPEHICPAKNTVITHSSPKIFAEFSQSNDPVSPLEQVKQNPTPY